MNKAKIALFGILFCAAAGGVLASKVRVDFPVYIFTNGTYSLTTTSISCPNTGLGCTKRIGETDFQEYTKIGVSYLPLKTTL